MGDWLTLAEILAVAAPDLPALPRALAAFAEREGWRQDGTRARIRFGQGGGYEYHVSLLPLPVQARLMAMVEPAVAAEQAPSALWSSFEALPERAKARAAERLQVVRVALDPATARSRKAAVALAAERHGVSTSSLWAWISQVDGRPRSDWLALLADRHTGGGKRSDIPQDAWDYFITDYLRLERPALAVAYDRTIAAAAAHGWGELPSLKTFQRRVAEVPHAAIVLGRHGREAAARLIPAQQRDRTVFASLEAVNADGYRHNVFVRWPDGTIARPISIAFQDVRSGLWLARRTDRTENKEAVRLCLADMVSRHGIPEHAYFDNGRHFASKWLTGRMEGTRFRFQVRDEEPAGILTTLGVRVHFTTPYHGQSKPIERSFRDIGETIDKHPLFAGAWTGNTVDAKPENYASKAIPLADFETVCRSEVQRHNSREGRRGFGMNGRSFLQVFETSLPEIGLRRATAEQRRLFLLAAEGVTARKPDGAVHLFESRFHHDALVDHIGERLIVRFDPQALAAGVAVYTLDNRFICEAARIEAVGFNSVEQAQERARLVTRARRAQRDLLDIHRRLDISDVARLTPLDVEEPQPEPARVTRLVAAGGGRAIPALDFDALATALDHNERVSGVIPLRRSANTRTER